ncbi:MAG: SPW repeat protein [Burkholderiaceae bacterium]
MDGEVALGLWLVASPFVLGGEARRPAAWAAVSQAWPS